MQPDSTPPNSGRVAFRYGLIIGLILAVVEVILLVITSLSFAASTPSSSSVSGISSSSIFSIILGILGFLLGLAAYFVAGILASRQTGKVSTGVFSGMWTGGFYGLIGCIAYIILFFTVTLGPTLTRYAQTNPANQVNSFHSILIGSALVGSLIGIALAIGWGAGLGALGGLIGRNSWRARHPQPLYPGQPYPGQPYVPMPQYPPAQGYPAQQPWPYPYQVQPGYGTPDPQRSESPGRADNVERTQIDRSYRPPEQANQAWSGDVPRPGASQEPENPYSS